MLQEMIKTDKGSHFSTTSAILSNNVNMKAFHLCRMEKEEKKGQNSFPLEANTLVLSLCASLDRPGLLKAALSLLSHFSSISPNLIFHV